MTMLRLVSSLLANCALLTAGNPAWSKPFPPHKVIGNVYYVGTSELSSYLVTTREGNILINSSYEESVPVIRAAVEKLGFKFSDTKILLISHAHDDHCAGSALVKKLTGAKYMVMEPDVPVVESGGAGDFQYASRYPATKVDRVLHDGDSVVLGEAKLTAHLTAGHTKGCTTWTLRVPDGGKTYDVVIVGSPNVNTGYKLVDNPRYPQIAADYARSFRVWLSLPCDVFLGAHGNYYGMEAKYKKLAAGGHNPFIDPAGYRAYITERQQAFETKLQAQRAGK
jgi:metallo-beta-lactamase class B